MDAEIIPIALKFAGLEENPGRKYKNGKSVIDYALTSPLFQSGIDFVLRGTDLGTTQYTDAFQRGALWGVGVQTNPAYQPLLGTPKVEHLVTLTVPNGGGSVGSPFGVKAIEANVNWFDRQLQPLLSKLPIRANSLPIFVTTQAYLTEGNACCIGGYHGYNGTYSYIDFTFIQKAGPVRAGRVGSQQRTWQLDRRSIRRQRDALRCV